MKLHIDTKDSKIVKVSLANSEQSIDQVQEENEFGSQVLLRLITDLLNRNNVDVKDLKEIEVEEGPGSFTGLRVGASVGQALGFALNIPVNGKLNKGVKLRYT